MGAGEPLETRVLDYFEGDAVLGPELLQLTHDTVSYVRYAFGIQAVHHRLNNVQLVLYREVDEVCVHKDVVGWTKLSVVLEEQR